MCSVIVSHVAHRLTVDVVIVTVESVRTTSIKASWTEGNAGCTIVYAMCHVMLRFLYARYPFLVIGFFMIIFSSIFGWTFGIIWGVCCFFILFGVKRCDGHCGTPSREHRVPTTDNLWKYWDAAEEIAVMSRM